MAIALVGEREDSKSVWYYPNSGGASPTWSADTGANTKSVAFDSSGNVYVVGTNSSSKNIWKYNSSGTLQASYNIGGAALDMWDVKLMSDDTVVVCGESDGSDYSIFTLDSGLSSATQRGLTTAGTSTNLDIDSSDNVYVNHVSTNLRVATRKKYNSSWVEQVTGFSGVGSDIDLNYCGIAAMSDGGFIHMFTYSVGYMRYYDSSGTGGGNVSDGNSYSGLFVDSNDGIYIGKGTTTHKYTYSGGSFSEDWSDNTISSDASTFDESSSGTLYCFTRVDGGE